MFLMYKAAISYQSTHAHTHTHTHTHTLLQVNEVKGSIKFQLKKVLCLGVAIGHVNMEENHIRGTWALCVF